MRWAHAVAVAVVVSSAPAGAQSWSGNVCSTPDANPFCAAVSMTYTANAQPAVGGRDAFSFTLSMTSGYISSFWFQIPFTFDETYFAISGERIAPGTPHGATYVGNNFPEPELSNDWGVQGYNMIGVLVGACGTQDVNDPTLWFAFITCDPNGGAPGSVTFDFGFDGDVTPETFTFGLNGLGCSWTGGQLNEGRVRGCVAVADVSAAPEPATLALLAPALLMLAWGYRKPGRRRVSL